MPAYNHDRFVEEAIRSVWDQTYPNLELIVINDGSVDGTAQVIEGLVNSSPIKMRFHTKSNEGICRTLNLGISMAEGEWIALLASDDKYGPEFIRKNMDTIKQLDLQGSVLHCDAYKMGSDGVVLGRISEISKKPPASGDAFLDIANGKCRIVSSTVVLPRKLMLDIGGYDESLKAEDFDMHLRVARHAKFHYITEPLFYSRYFSNSLGRSPWLWGDDIYTALIKHENELGTQLNRILLKRSRKLFNSCIQHGSGFIAFKYWGFAIHYSSGFLETSRTLILLFGEGVITLFRTLLKKMLPNRSVVLIRKFLWSIRNG